MFKHAVLRKPGKNFVNAIAQDAHHAKPNYAKAMHEYEFYADTLQSMGLTLTVAEADEQFPDPDGMLKNKSLYCKVLSC